jgi:RND family efflux transporter MFP subunit
MTHSRQWPAAAARGPAPAALALARARALAAIAVAIAVAAPLSMASCARRAAVVERPPRAVKVAAAEKRDFFLAEDLAARISPLLEVNISPKVGGRVAALRADVGGRVAKGQVLMELDASDYAAQYRQARAALAGAKAGLARTSDSGQEQQVIQARSAADQAQVAYDDAKSLYEKTSRLYASGAVSKQQLDDVEARFKGAGIQMEAARRALELVENKAGSQASDVASGQVDAASAQADLAKNQLDAATLRSPIAGRISYRGVEVGEMAGTSTLAFIVIDDSFVLAQALLSERQVGLVKPGMEIEASVPAAGTRPFPGRVDSVSPAADPRSLMYAMKLRVPNPEGALKGGMIARLRLPVETRRGAIVVPERAVFSENGLAYAFVAARSPAAGSAAAAAARSAYVAEKRQLSLGETDGTYVEALKGIEPGELVVVEGKEFISDGDPIAASK